MARESLEGITGGTSDEPISEEEQLDVLKERVSEIRGIDSVSDLLDALGREEVLEGISVDIQEEDRGARRVEDLRRQVRQQQQQRVLEIQLEELEQIDDDTDLLRRIAGNISTTNNKIDTLINSVETLITIERRDNSLKAKDENVIQIDQSNSSREIVEDENISSSFVLVKANPSNNGSMFVGGQETSVGNGFELEPGESELFPVDVIVDEFNIVSERNGDKYTYITFGVEE